MQSSRQRLLIYVERLAIITIHFNPHGGAYQLEIIVNLRKTIERRYRWEASETGVDSRRLSHPTNAAFVGPSLDQKDIFIVRRIIRILVDDGCVHNRAKPGNDMR